MKNKDKYLKDGVSPKAMWYEFKNWYNDTQCTCAYGEAIEIFMKEPVKPTLTEDEKVILRNIKGLKEIYRSTNEDGDLGVTCEICNGYIAKYWINAFNHLFQFIQERRRI